MSEEKIKHELTNNPLDIPLPLVTFSRWVYFTILVASIVTQFQPGISVLFLLLFPAVLFGKKWNLIGRAGKVLLNDRLHSTQYEDRRLIQFNNVLLLLFLAAAQAAFLFGFNLAGWIVVTFAIAANGLALAGFCIGCVLYYQFRLYRYSGMSKIKLNSRTSIVAE